MAVPGRSGPAAWGVDFWIADADRAAASAPELGGSVIAAPMTRRRFGAPCSPPPMERRSRSASFGFRPETGRRPSGARRVGDPPAQPGVAAQTTATAGQAPINSPRRWERKRNEAGDGQPQRHPSAITTQPRGDAAQATEPAPSRPAAASRWPRRRRIRRPVRTPRRGRSAPAAGRAHVRHPIIPQRPLPPGGYRCPPEPPRPGEEMGFDQYHEPPEELPARDAHVRAALCVADRGGRGDRLV